MNELKEKKREKQISSIQDRIAGKNIGKTSSGDAELLTLLKIGTLLERQTELLEIIAKVTPKQKRTPWWTFARE